MKREETKFCEECKNCEQIIRYSGECYCIQCLRKTNMFHNPVVYCKYKKIKKEKK